jgi:hypothetical protein
MGWFNTGFESTSHAYDFDDGSKGPRRYWMPPDTEKRVIFLDDDPTTFWEHNFKHKGSWRNWEPCFPMGAEVMTVERGVVPIEDVVVGDLVITHTGNRRRVIHTMDRVYGGDMVELALPKLPPLVATGNHGIYAVRCPRNGSGRVGRHRMYLEEQQPIKIQAREIVPGDYVWVPAVTGEKSLPLLGEGFDGRLLTQDMAWLIGLYAADGSASRGAFFISLGLHEMDLATRAIDVLGREFGVKARIIEQHNCIRIYLGSVGFCRLFREMCGSCASEKRLPHYIVSSDNQDIIRSAVEGVYDGDGHTDSNSVTVSVTSRTLAMQVHEIWLRMGYAPSIYTSPRENPRHDIYVVKRPIQGSQYGVHVRSDGMFVKVKAVKSWQTEEPVFNIEVDGDHSYTVGGVGVANCKKRNRMDDDCAVCDRYPDRKPSFIGMLSVINMTPWESKQGREFCYGRELFVAKLGGKDKPGVLKKLERLKKQHGGLTGCVFDIYRSGGKTESVGDEFTLVEKIEPKDIAAFGKRHLKEWAQRINEQIDDPEKYLTLDKLWERAPWEPYDYSEILEVRSNEELRVMFSTAGTADDDIEDDSVDEDVPF